MARTALQKVYADFRQGFVSVANPLAFPEGSLKECINFDIQDNGTLKKRPGLRWESNTGIDAGQSLATLTNWAVTCHVWDNVNNVGGDKIAVVQVGNKISLFNMLDSGIDMDNPVALDIQLDMVSDGFKKPISTASGGGWLFIAHPDMDPVYLKKTNAGVEVNDIDIKIRDLYVWQGKTDEETGFSDGSLYPQHQYNLRNGGWPESCRCSVSFQPNDGVVIRDPITYTNESINQFPRISIPFSSGRAGGGDSLAEQVAYSPWAIINDYYGNSIVPVGKFIVSAKQWTRNGIGETPLVEGNALSKLYTNTYSWTQKPSNIAFYAGRVWYSGVKGYNEQPSLVGLYSNPEDLDVSNTIYFSQVINDNLKNISKCYQEADPTAEDINQLLPTDGGTLAIRGVGEIYDMVEFNTSLIVFSSEGVWSISGKDGNSFNADSYSVNKISNKGPSSRTTIASSTGTVFYAADDAIYAVVQDQVTGLPSVQDISSGKIKDFYVNISYGQKERARTVFDSNNRILYMFYADVPEQLGTYANLVYNKCLVFNQDLGCFYKYEVDIGIDNMIVDGIFYEKDQTVTLSTPVTLDDVPVTLDGEPVTLDDSYTLASLNAIQMLTLSDTDTKAEYRFSTFTNVDDFQDWNKKYVGVAEFGFDTAGDIMRDSLQAPVIITHMERTEDGFEINPDSTNDQELVLKHRSDCLLKTGWDWATNYGREQQLYRFTRHYIPSGTDDEFNYGKDVITTRNRIRGKGHSLGIQLLSRAGFDARLLGIGILYTNKDRV